MSDIGNLATALATFQGRIGAIPRSKTVKVTSKKTNTTYTFDYAPHEAIIAAIQKPLADCGLAVSQQLATLPDGLPALRTILLHSSGERLDDVFPLPTADGMTSQELGSTITYIRRYALSAILGLATEDDDDANRAAGNEATFQPRTPAKPQPSEDGSLLGIVEVGDKTTSDFQIRKDSAGMSHLGFRLKGDRGGILVEASGLLADGLYAFREDLVGQRVTCWGTIADRSFQTKGDKPRKVVYQVLSLERLTGPGGIILPVFDEAPSIPLGLVDEASDAELGEVVQ